MTIAVYSGLTGSGKSYNAVANLIIPALKQGRTVVTNVVLKKDAIYSDVDTGNLVSIPFKLGKDDVEKYINNSLYPAGSVFVLDEAGRFFPPNWKQDRVPEHVLTFFTEHRHSVGVDGYATDIYLLCQDVSQLSKWIRDLVANTYCHKKLDQSVPGMKDKFRVDIFEGAVTNSTTSKSKFIQDKFGTYNSSVFKYYESHTQKNPNVDTALEDPPDKRSTRATKLRNFLILFLVLLFLSLYLGFTAFSDFNNDSLPEEQTHDTEEQAQPVQLKIVDNPLRDYIQPSYQATKESQDWKLVGVIIGIQPKQRKWALLRSQSSSRRIDLLNNCYWEKDAEEWICWFRNELVASYTGPVFKNPDEQEEVGDEIAQTLSL